METSENELIVGKEYFLDESRFAKGIFVKNNNNKIYFKPTSKNSYTEDNGLVVFSVEGYLYLEVIN